MATKFTLQPKPTFKANVSIPRAGDEDGVLTFTFNHKPLKELADLETVSVVLNLQSPAMTFYKVTDAAA